MAAPSGDAAAAALCAERRARDAHCQADWAREAAAWDDATKLTDRTDFAICAVEALIRDDRPAEALSRALSLYARHGEDVAVLGLLATVSDAAGDAPRALCALRRLATLAPDDRVLACRLATRLQAAGDRHEAAARLAELCRRWPDDPAVLELAARRARDEAGPEAALTLAKRAVQGLGAEDPRLTGLRRLQASLLMDLARPSETVAVLAQAVAADPVDLETQLMMADAEASAGAPQAAIDRWQALAVAMPDALRPRHALALLGVEPAGAQEAVLHARETDARVRLRALASCCRAHPREPAPLLDLARALAEQGERRAAIGACQRALALDPARPGDWAYCAGLMREEGKHADALALLDEGLRHHPGAAALMRDVLTLTDGLGLHDRAMAAAEVLLALHEAHADDVSKDGERKDEASSILRRLVRLALAVEDFAGAADWLKRLSQGHPAGEQCLAIDCAGWNGRRAAAAEALLAAPGAPGVLLRLAQCALEDGDFDRAANLLARAAEGEEGADSGRGAAEGGGHNSARDAARRLHAQLSALGPALPAPQPRLVLDVTLGGAEVEALSRALDMRPGDWVTIRRRGVLPSVTGVGGQTGHSKGERLFRARPGDLILVPFGAVEDDVTPPVVAGFRRTGAHVVLIAALADGCSAPGGDWRSAATRVGRRARNRLAALCGAVDAVLALDRVGADALRLLGQEAGAVIHAEGLDSAVTAPARKPRHPFDAREHAPCVLMIVEGLAADPAGRLARDLRGALAVSRPHVIVVGPLGREGSGALWPGDAGPRPVDTEDGRLAALIGCADAAVVAAKGSPALRWRRWLARAGVPCHGVDPEDVSGGGVTALLDWLAELGCLAEEPVACGDREALRETPILAPSDVSGTVCLAALSGALSGAGLSALPQVLRAVPASQSAEPLTVMSHPGDGHGRAAAAVASWQRALAGVVPLIMVSGLSKLAETMIRRDLRRAVIHADAPCLTGPAALAFAARLGAIASTVGGGAGGAEITVILHGVAPDDGEHALLIGLIRRAGAECCVIGIAAAASQGVPVMPEPVMPAPVRPSSQKLSIVVPEQNDTAGLAVELWADRGLSPSRLAMLSRAVTRAGGHSVLRVAVGAEDAGDEIRARAEALASAPLDIALVPRGTLTGARPRLRLVMGANRASEARAALALDAPVAMLSSEADPALAEAVLVLDDATGTGGFEAMLARLSHGRLARALCARQAGFVERHDPFALFQAHAGDTGCSTLLPTPTPLDLAAISARPLRPRAEMLSAVFLAERPSADLLERLDTADHTGPMARIAEMRALALQAAGQGRWIDLDARAVATTLPAHPLDRVSGDRLASLPAMLMAGDALPEAVAAALGLRALPTAIAARLAAVAEEDLRAQGEVVAEVVAAHALVTMGDGAADFAAAHPALTAMAWLPGAPRRARRCHRLSVLAATLPELRGLVWAREVQRREPSPGEMALNAALDPAAWLDRLRRDVPAAGDRLVDDVDDVGHWAARFETALEAAADIAAGSILCQTGNNLMLIRRAAILRALPGVLLG
ncbi:MAG: hypothetical protein AAF577_02925 [Pseudomonadota bacterium]